MRIPRDMQQVDGVGPLVVPDYLRVSHHIAVDERSHGGQDVSWFRDAVITNQETEGGFQSEEFHDVGGGDFPG
jgi:hypothetical protein